ncbi:MAG TPA: alpha/beta hydrolase [Ktedonosporobacter sp.]|nr:alpha/beta hydrolase [Ktedonosporobacter sp.]
MTTLQIGDQTLDYNQHTDGDTPVIFIHGIMSCQYTWLDFPLRFARYGRIVTLSLPGHYPARFSSDMPQSSITDEWVGDTMAAAIEQISAGKPAILIGHSTGGYASLAAAWRAPHLVKYVISLAGFARGIWTSFLGVNQRLLSLGKPGEVLFDAQMKLSTRNAVVVDAAWRLCSYDKVAFDANSVYRAMRPKIMSHLSHLDVESLRKWFYQMRNVADLTPHLSAIMVPVLAIAGEQDILVPPEQTVHIVNGVVNGTCILLDKMNHALFVEQPERVQKCMMEWLDAQAENGA